MQLERSGREQKELGAGLEADLEAVNEKFSKLQQDHETQMSLYQQLEMELARKSSELSEKEDIEIQVRSEILMQKKEIDNLGKKISALESLKTELEHDKEKLKTDIASKNKEVEELQHQALVTKKDLNILENAKEGVEMKLERSAQTIKNEAFKVNSTNPIHSNSCDCRSSQRKAPEASCSRRCCSWKTLWRGSRGSSLGWRRSATGAGNLVKDVKKNPGTWVRELSRRNGLTACWRRAGMLRRYCSTQRNRLLGSLTIVTAKEKHQVAEGRAELRKQQNLYHR